MQEPRARKWTVGEAALDSLAAGMLVTLLLDFWRLYLGGINDGQAGGKGGMVWS